MKIGTGEKRKIKKTEKNYVEVIEQHLARPVERVMKPSGRGGRHVGQFAPAGILDDAAGIGVKSVRDGSLHLRHVVLAEPVRFAQVHLQALLRRKAQSAFRLRTPER